MLKYTEKTQIVQLFNIKINMLNDFCSGYAPGVLCLNSDRLLGFLYSSALLMIAPRPSKLALIESQGEGG